MTPKPWDADYKPRTAAEAFDPSAPLPESALQALDYINRKDARIAELEDALHAVMSLGYISGGMWKVAEVIDQGDLVRARAVLALSPTEGTQDA